MLSQIRWIYVYVYTVPRAELASLLITLDDIDRFEVSNNYHTKVLRREWTIGYYIVVYHIVCQLYGELYHFLLTFRLLKGAIITFFSVLTIKVNDLDRRVISIDVFYIGKFFSFYSLLCVRCTFFLSTSWTTESECDGTNHILEI